MSVDYKQLAELSNRLKKTSSKVDVDEFIDGCAKELASRFLALVIKDTPVGKYPKSTGKRGGTLRRGWTGGQKAGADYANTLPIHHFGGTYVIEILNPVDYASYVEFGHRTRGGKDWVNGQFFMTHAEAKVQTASRAILEKRLRNYLEGIFGK